MDCPEGYVRNGLSRGLCGKWISYIYYLVTLVYLGDISIIKIKTILFHKQRETWKSQKDARQTFKTNEDILGKILVDFGRKTGQRQMKLFCFAL